MDDIETKYKTQLPYAPYKADPEKYKAHMDDQRRLREQFKADLFAEHGVTGHPKAARCFELAWDYGHASGFAEVANYFADLVTLLDAKESP